MTTNFRQANRASLLAAWDGLKADKVLSPSATINRRAALAVEATAPAYTYTPSPVAAVSAPAASVAKVALSAADAAAIMAQAGKLGLGALGAKLIARGVTYTDALELLAAAGGGAVAHSPAPAAGGAAPAGGGVDAYNARLNEAVATARAFAQARGMGRARA
ncbi:hypothetical protein [Devosia sp.]|jgi:hypothetical protein|uniref:hypothetical protein n=1 Tax=Devosia sp. TaxID=1871048 RepID=UPI0037C19413